MKKDIIEKIQLFIISCFNYLGYFMACFLLGIICLCVCITPANKKIIDMLDKGRFL